MRPLDQKGLNIWVWNCIKELCKESGEVLGLTSNHLKVGPCTTNGRPLPGIFLKMLVLSQELIFCSEAPLPNPTLSISGKNSFFSEMVQNGPDGPKRVPSGQKHLGWPFWSLLDHFDKLKSLPCLAIFGPKWTIFWPSPMMSGGHRSKKRLITTSSMCGLLVVPNSSCLEH